MAFRKSRPEIGSRPGTLAIPAGSPPPKIKAVQYDAKTFRVHDVASPDGLKDILDWDGVCWIDVQGLGDEAVLWKIAEQFNLGPFALEDAVNVPQRAKSEAYDEFQLIIARMPIVGDDGVTDVPQVCFVVGPRWLITFQERYFGFFEPVRERLRAGAGPIRSRGPDYLAYAMIDTLIDRYFPIAEDLSRELDEIEDSMGESSSPEILADIHRIRRQLVILRRVGRPQREAVNAMVREQTPFITDEVRDFLRDTEGHISQIMELIDSSREMALALSEVYMANMSNKTNEIMKVLTLMASIFIPLTFIAGIYGMNFEHMPELSKKASYFIVLGVMAAVALGMILYFRRRGWVGKGRSKDDKT